MSLCSQRCTCGRLTRSLHWLEKECEDGIVCGVKEVRLALGISWVGCIGCGCGDDLDALTALSSLCECDDKGNDKEKSDKIKGRALACTACCLRWGKEMTPFDSLLNSQDETLTVNTRLFPIDCLLGFTVAQSMKLLTQAVEIGDSFALERVNSCCFAGHVLPRNEEISVKLYQKAAEMGNTNAMVNLAL